jgi:hypothetical protein
MLSCLRVNALAVSAAVFLMSTPVWACKGKTELMRDDFSDIDPAWAKIWDSNNFDISGGSMNVFSDKGLVSGVLYKGSFFGDGDACIDITMPKQPKEEEGGSVLGGLVLRGAGGDMNIFNISLDGKANVSKLTSDGWLQPVPAEPSDFLNPGPGAKNNLRVTWTSTAPAVTIYLNGKQWKTARIPPNRDRMIGFMVDSQSPIAFNNLVITK